MPDLIKVKCMCDVTLIIVFSAQLCDPTVLPEDSAGFSLPCFLSFPCWSLASLACPVYFFAVPVLAFCLLHIVMPLGFWPYLPSFSPSNPSPGFFFFFYPLSIWLLLSRAPPNPSNLLFLPSLKLVTCIIHAFTLHHLHSVPSDSVVPGTWSKLMLTCLARFKERIVFVLLCNYLRYSKYLLCLSLLSVTLNNACPKLLFSYLITHSSLFLYSIKLYFIIPQCFHW